MSSTFASTVWAAQDGLLTALKQEQWPEQVTPKLGTPANLDRDQIWVSGEVDDWQADYPVSGYAQMDETFFLRVHVLATRLGGYEELRVKLTDYGSKTERAIVSDFTLGGAVANARIDRRTVEETMADDGRTRQGLLTFWVKVEAWVPKQ